MRLHCLARYANRTLGISAQAGDVVDVDADTADLLQRDAPLCWAAEIELEPEAETEELSPPDGPPVDRMISRRRGRPPTRKGAS